LAAAQGAAEYGEYNIGGDRAYSFDDVLAAVENATGKTIVKHVVPSTVRDDSWALDITKAHTFLGWKPRITLPEGIQRTVECKEDQSR
jgi:nucleoside-diphosphate-sugar epimerase